MRIFFFCCFLLLQTVIFSQEKTASFHVINKPIIGLLNQIETAYNVKFSYSDELLSNKKITFKANNSTLDNIIFDLNATTDLYFEPVSKRNIIILSKINKNPNFNTEILDEIVIKNYLTNGIDKQQNGSFKISPKKLNILPGITEPDVFQSIQLLPGVISLDETSTEIHVRGGAPDQNLILWDGIKIYHSGHLFGTFSAFNPYITNDVTFINKGTNAKYGDKVSSVINIQTNNEIIKKFKGGFGFNLIEADVFIETPIIKDKLSVLFSVRRSFTDVILSNTYIKLSDKVFQHETENSIFKGDNNFYYFDYNLKLNWKISENDDLNFSFISIENQLKTDFDDDDDDKNVFSDKFETENRGYNLKWTKKWNTKLSHQINTYFSNYNFSIFQERKTIDNFVSTIEKTNTVADFGINFNLNYKIKANQSIETGYQYSNNNINLTTSNNQTNRINSINNSDLNTHAFYTSYYYKNNKIFNFVAGLRLNYYASLNKFELAPRLNIYKELTPHLNLNITAERKTQAISQLHETTNIDLTSQNQIWVIANPPQIPIINSFQISGGFTYSKNNWNLEIDTYYKTIENLTTLNNGFIDIEDFKFSQGESTVKGVDFYLKKQFNNYKTWVSYTFNDIKNNFEGINESETFSANIDITHNFYWSHEYTYKQFQFALGWRWHTGKPYSNAIGIETDSNGIDYLIYEGINTSRLPNYKRMDFSSMYNFNLSKEKNIKAKIGLSILNIFNEVNTLNRSFTINNLDNQINTIDTKSLQRVSNIVFRVSW